MTGYFRRLDIKYLMEEKPFCPIPVGGPKTTACQVHICRDTDEGDGEVTLCGNFYRMQSDPEHIHTFECIVRVTPSYTRLGKLDDQEATGI